MFRLALCLVALAATALAGPTVLVDHLHGHADLDRLQAVWPDAELTVLGPLDHPIDTVLLDGVAYAEEELTFMVPPDQEALYGYFLCDDSMYQYPFISVIDPQGVMRCGGFYGGFHLEDPAPGEWTLRFDDWEPELRPYTIGTGPHLLTADLLGGYDAVVRIYDETGLLFHGDVPRYTTREEAAVEAYLAAGGAHLYLREPLVDMALKPVIDLTADVDLACDLSIGLPGRLSYAEPAADVDDGVATWHDVEVLAGNVTQLLYEVAMTPPHHHLRVTTTGQPTVANLTDQPLRELMLVRHVAGDRWLLAGGSDLAPGAERSLPDARELARDDLRATLVGAMHQGGLTAGLSNQQMTAFQGHYHWVDRLMLDASNRAGWTALYRGDAPLCDDLLPLVADPPAAQRTRTLWFWVTGIPDGLTGQEPWPQTVTSPVVNQPDHGAGPLQVAEYGVILQRYPVDPAAKDRDQDWLGWTFHDDFQLVDTDDNLNDPYLPLLDTLGGHLQAMALLAGLDAVGGVTCGGIVAPYAERLVTGDGDTYSDDWFFQPGSFPPFAVARSLGDGRAAAVASRFVTGQGVPENAIYLQRLLTWLTDVMTPVEELLPTPAVAVNVHPNPFNPATTITYRVAAAGPVTITLHDAAGHLVRRLFSGRVAAGEHTVAWQGRDDAQRPVAAGVYLLRVQAAGQDAVRKLTLVE